MEVTHDKTPSHRRASRTDARKLTEKVSDENDGNREEGSRLPEWQTGHAVCNDRHAARGKPALEGRMCHACRGTRLVTDPTGTVHARGSEMKISGLLHRITGCVNPRDGVLRCDSRAYCLHVAIGLQHSTLTFQSAFNSMKTPSVLFICTGNICRSPTAHVLLMHKARAAGFDVEVDSAAISNEECGNPPDPRSVAEARRRGIEMHAHCARQVRKSDFDRFELIIGMTAQHCAALRCAGSRPPARPARSICSPNTPTASRATCPIRGTAGRRILSRSST